MRQFVFACVVWLVVVSVCAGASQAEDYIDLGIETTDVFVSGSGGSTDLTTINPISLLTTVRNYSSIALDGFTLTPTIKTYFEGTLLTLTNGAFYFQPNYINSAPSTPLSIDMNGAMSFRADITRPRAGHYRCEIAFTLGGSIANRDANTANNQTVIEFDVREEARPMPDLSIENVRIIKTGDRFQIGYDVKNIGTDPAESVFTMDARLYVSKGPTVIMIREDDIRQPNQPIAPGASVSMGPFDVRDSRDPNAALSDGSYKIIIFTLQGCKYDAAAHNNHVETPYDYVGGIVQTAAVIDLGIETTDVFVSGSGGSTDLTTINPISLLTTVRNYSSIALDGFTLTPTIKTYFEGTLLTLTNGAFYFQPNYINSAPSTPLSIDMNGTMSFRADITRPRAGHYRCEIAFTLGGSIANRDANTANNQTVIEFDVREEARPMPDLSIENVRIIKTGGRFQIGYGVKNVGTDPAESVFSMKAKIYVSKGPTVIMNREDVFRQDNQPIAPGAFIPMGPFDVRDSRSPDAELDEDVYRVIVDVTRSCKYDADAHNNRVEMNYHYFAGSGDYSIDGVPTTCEPGTTLTVRYRCAWPHQTDLTMGLFGNNESGIHTKLDSQTVSGSSGALKFKTPKQPNRCLFKIQDVKERIVASSDVFSVAWPDSEGSLGSTRKPRPEKKGPSIMKNDTLNRTGLSGAIDRSPDVKDTRKRSKAVKHEQATDDSKGPATKVPLKKASMLKKRSAETDTLDQTEGISDQPCDENPIFSGLDGYDMDECIKRYDEAVIRVDETPNSPRNPRLRGEITTVRYTWPDDGGPSPSDHQIKGLYTSEAKTMGADILVDRPHYTAFELKSSGRTVFVSLETDEGGQIIRFMSIEPVTEIGQPSTGM